MTTEVALLLITTIFKFWLTIFIVLFPVWIIKRNLFD